MRGLGLALALFGPFALAALGERRGRPALGEAVVAQAALAGIVVAVLWLALRHDGLTAAQLGFRPLRWPALALGGLLALFFVRGYGPAVYALLRRLRVTGFEGGLAKLAGLPFWYLCLAVAIGASAEEILYRGYAIARLESLTGSLWLAALVPLVIFGLAHVPMWGWAPALTTVAAGGIFSAVFLVTRDLAPCIVAHVATDFVGIVLSRRPRAA
ncbi:MAG TPA: CPBP family intramembrane glutamic endopeptidase [Myxococcota bacterium]|nr:CPBP family intramembrane glutamic endopeptidase [Myxococcota bacterium]